MWVYVYLGLQQKTKLFEVFPAIHLDSYFIVLLFF